MARSLLYLLLLGLLTACGNPFAPARVKCRVTGEVRIPYISTDGRDTTYAVITTEWCE